MNNINKEYFGRYISILYRQASVFYSKEFNKFGIGAGQYMFMIHLYKNDGISQEKLSELINIDKGTTAKAIKKLEELGYVERNKDISDKRVNKIYLTDKALEIKNEFLTSLNKWENMLTLNLSDEEILYGLKILNKLTKNVSKKQEVINE